MKVCTACKVEKSTKEFNKNKAKSDGLNNICRKCSNENSRSYYSKNRTKHRKAVRTRTDQVVQENQQRLLRHLMEHPCVDCGETDPLVLEFDHVRGKKKREVTRLVKQGYRWETVVEEIEKCEVRCANCHRRKTYKRSGSYRAVVA